MELWRNFAVALALGLLIGLERGWQERAAAEGARIAGIRTFGLISLLGGVWALLAEQIGAVLLGFAFLAFTAAVIAAHVVESREHREYGITTEVAALLTFALGALAVLGHLAIAAAAAVVSVTLLGLKPVLHRWLQQLEEKELFAALKLLIISVVLLPVLPNRGFGPWDALNPYTIWWLVVLIATISFVGYFAIKITGPHIGIMLTSVFGGLASSTALTLDFARLGRHNPGIQRLLAAGVAVAAATMFPRVLLEVGVVNASLLPALVGPLATMTVVSYGMAGWVWYSSRGRKEQPQVELPNPFELLPALKFGALLVAVMLLSTAFQLWFGEVGVYFIAAVSGLSDVDAITLSLARLSRGALSDEVAVRAIVLAAMVNTAVKGLLVAGICGGAMMRRVGAIFAFTIAAGIAALMTG